MNLQLPYPIHDTKVLIQHALFWLTRIYHEKFTYSKAEILLAEIYRLGEIFVDFLTSEQRAIADKIMATLDSPVSLKHGLGTCVQLALVMGWVEDKAGYLSQRFDTRIEQAWRV